MAKKKSSKKRKGQISNWNKVFVEIALRAIRQVHLSYGMWGLGQETTVSSDYGRLNQGPGIEVALEPEVCAAITQEFINSRFTNGAFVGNKHRHYEIDREVRFKRKSSGHYDIDIFIDRFRIKGKTTQYYKYPALIQAKRAHTYTPIISKGALGVPIPNWTGIRKDVKKLVEIRSDKLKPEQLRYYKNVVDYFLYLLIWDYVDLTQANSKQKSEQEHKDDVMKKLNRVPSQRTSIELRWLPLEWSASDFKVKKWLWLALIEIDPRKSPPDAEADRNWFPKLR